MRPDGVGVAAIDLRACARVDDEDRVYPSVAVVVVVGEVHHRVDQRHHVLGQALAVAGVSVPYTALPIDIVTIGLRGRPPAQRTGQVERDNIQQAVAHFAVVAAHRRRPGAENQRVEECRAHLGRLVGELHQDGQRAEGIGRSRFKTRLAPRHGE